MSRVVVFSLGFLVFLFQPPVFSADDHADGTPSTGRATQAVPLTDREIDFIYKNFYLSKKTISQKYAEKLPLAIEKALKSQDEKEVSEMVANLMGLVNSVQAKRVAENAESELKSEEAKKPGGADDRYIALMQRFQWGAKAFLSDPSKEEAAAKFNEEFDNKSKNVATRNAEILEKIKQAAEGNEQAKEWLRKNLDQNSLLLFAEGQKKTGNGNLADRLIDGLSFKEGKNKFLDMTQSEKTQRLHLGQSPQSVSDAFTQFLDNQKSFNGSVVSFVPFEGQPTQQWFVDTTGAFKPGAPGSFNKVPTVANKPSPPASNNRVSSAGSGATNSNSGSSAGTQPPPPANSGSSQNQRAAAFSKITKVCSECHDISIDSRGVLSKDSEPVSKESILNAINKYPKMKRRLPSNSPETIELIKLINTYLNNP